MGATTNHRTTLGEHFSEGARLLWGLVREYPSIAAFQREHGFHNGEVARLLYGDLRPNIDRAVKLQALGIPPSAWLQKPTKRFTPPAAGRGKAA